MTTSSLTTGLNYSPDSYSRKEPLQKPEPGFINFTLASQTVFRLALAALSRPTKVFEADFEGFFKGKPPLPYTAAALALTLLDHQTAVWLSPSFRESQDYLTFHTSAPMAGSPEKGSFLLVASPKELPPLDTLNQGDPRYPDRSATVILAGVLEKTIMEIPLIAKGPGIKDEALFENHGLDRNFVNSWSLNRESYPLGLDIILAGNNKLVGLPRSLRLIPKPS
jgi:alpha-D-ribose 1-methylphosphonate 5-triphosphate synthase subunit PhnH